jgi:hypothetical protein
MREKSSSSTSFFIIAKETCCFKKGGLNMKRLILILALFVLFLPCVILAKERDFGLGVIVGEPTGLSFKKWMTKTAAIDAAAAWSFVDDSFHIHADYLLHSFSVFKVERGKLLVYYGLGGRISTEAELRVGIRVPAGLSYTFENSPLDIFFEIGPILDLTPATEFRLTGGLGIRYFF